MEWEERQAARRAGELESPPASTSNPVHPYETPDEDDAR